MMRRNLGYRLRLIFLLSVIFVSHAHSIEAQLTVFGYVYDNMSEPVSGVRLRFVDESAPEISYESRTDANGRYELFLPAAVENDVSTRIGMFDVSQNYPNPFNPLTTIPFHLFRSSDVKLTIFNILGQRITTLVDDTLPPGHYAVRWDATDERGNRVSAGVYFYHVQFGRYCEVKKMLLLDSGGGKAGSASSYPITNRRQAAERVTNTTFRVTIVGDGIDIYEQSGIHLDHDQQLDFSVNKSYPVPFSVVGDYLAIWNGTRYNRLFIIGMNLGVATPGTQPGELAATREQYQRWFSQMGELGINAIRVYTLHYPRFYEELAAYNLQHRTSPLYLFQGVWLDEELASPDLFDASDKFDADIEEVIDCVHGNRTVEHRFGRAYGEYTESVARWTIGYIIGREIYPDEVLATNEEHPEEISYAGSAVRIDLVTPVDAWATARIDHAITYERAVYGVERPLSVSSWPTLDPLIHPTERPESREDIVSLDLADIDTYEAPAGYFASYHAYPYYPDFMNEDPGYQQFSDEYGVNNYIGYLHDLKEHYHNFPLIIAEFGVPSSWGNAHSSTSGMHHGGLDEFQQGTYNVRMLKNIFESQCGGGIAFAWIDEWFKNSWITEPIGSESPRRHFWHNVTNPEQNYGFIAFDSGDPDYSYWEPLEQEGFVARIQAAYDNEFFYCNLTFDDDLREHETMIVGFDTYRSDLGESVLPNGLATANRAEFSLYIALPDTAQLYVTEAYDTFGIWHGISGEEQLYHSIATDGAPWIPVRWKNNYRDEDVHDIGRLRIRAGNEQSTRLDAVTFGDRSIEIRIPWTLLQFTDPSTLEVLHDYRSTPERETAITDGVALVISAREELVETGCHVWTGWNMLSNLQERKKACYGIFKDGITEIPSNIDQIARY